MDFSPCQRELVYKYIIDRFGEEKTAYILAIGTVSDKGTIDDIGRALDKQYKDKGLKSPYSLTEVKKIKKEYEENPNITKEKYSELFYYFDGIVNSVVSQSVHPAGIVASPVTLTDNYGTFWKDGMKILQIDMEEVHEVSLVKYDILGLKTIGIIKDCCDYANIPYPKAHDINFNDDEVWDDMIKYPYGIFQFESKYANELLGKFSPHKINDMNLVNASLRPSGESFRDNLIAGIPNKNPSDIIDNLLKDNNGYLVFQEDTIAFLQDICGLSGSDADNIRRAIGRKQRDRLDKAMPQILEGYCNKSGKQRNVAEKEAEEFLQIISDSSSYQFGKNHATGYSMLGYYCAYLRYYYPVCFVTSYLNNSEKEEDLINGEELARLLNIEIKQPKFRYSKAEYMMNKSTNSIYKGIASIKYLNKECSEYMYTLKDNSYESFIDLLIDLQGHINTRQMEILIKLDFFSEFGGSNKLLNTYEMFNNLYQKKQVNKNKYPYLNNIFEKFAEKETASMYKLDPKSLDILKHIESQEENIDLPIVDRIKCWLENVGSCDIKDKSRMGEFMVLDIDTKYQPRITLYSLGTSVVQDIKIPKKIYTNNKLEQYDIIKLIEYDWKFKRKKVNDEWIQTDEKYLSVSEYYRIEE